MGLANTVVLTQNQLVITKLTVPKTVQSGKHFTFLLEIQAFDTTSALPIIKLSLPNKWTILTEKIPTRQALTLKYMYTVGCPSSATADDYTMMVKRVLNNTVESLKSIKIKVEKIRSIEITPLNIPEYIKEGDSLKVDFLVQNTGNAAEKVKITTSKGKILGMLDSLKLQNNQSIKLTVCQKIPVMLDNTWYTSVDINVFLKDSANPISSIVSIPVYATQNKQKDPYVRFPLEIGATYVGAGGDNSQAKALQYDVKGKGFLDINQHHFLDFIVHGPDQFLIPIIGSYEVLSLFYRYKKQTIVQVGDYNLQATNLMEFGRFGRGFRIDHHINKTAVSVFYIKPRFFTDQSTEYGASLKYQVATKWQVGINYITKNFQLPTPIFTANIVSLSSKYITKGFDIETEIAGSEAKGKNDVGIFNNVVWNLKKLQINSNIIYAGKNFNGFYRNSWQSITAINYFVSKKISVGFNHNVTRINPSLDLLVYNSSPFVNSVMGTLSYQMNRNNSLTLSYNWQVREDRLEPKTFHYQEGFANLGYHYFSEKFNFSYNGRVGTAQNLLVPNDEAIQRSSIANALYPQVCVFPSLWIGAILEYQRTSKFSATNAITNYYFYGGTVRFKRHNWLNFSLMYRNNYTPDLLTTTQSFLNGTVEINTKHHLVSLSAGRAFIPNAININNINQNTVYFSLKYAFKLNVGIAKNRKVGNVVGHVIGYGEEVKYADVIVRLGDKKAITDKNGNFYFNNLLPDKYYLTVDKSTLANGTTPIHKAPVEVTVKQDFTHVVALKLIKTGAVYGKVDWQQQTGLKSFEVLHEQPTILVKLMNDNETFTTKVTDKGEFSFKEMLPGDWRIIAWIPGQQSQYSLLNAEQNVQILPDEIKKLNFTVKASEKKIHFSEKSFQLYTQQK
jgi:hypothetical protein